MNIVKFHDTHIENDDTFNGYFKGKYCYAPHMTWAVPFDNLTESEYTNLEVDGDISIVSTYINISDYAEFIDEEATERANSVAKYVSFNNFVPDTDISLDDLKLFRRWLASTLLEMDKDIKSYDEKITQMLTYYQMDMYDDVVKQLSNFRIVDNKIVFTNMSTCNCTPVIGAQLSTESICDPIAQYRQAIYEFMVQTFSNIDFWKDLDVEFLQEFKAYIEGIIGYNLPLYISDYVSEFADCSCVNVANTAQELLQRILKNLATSLQYMIDNQVDGHKNFIADSLREWSSKLYEKMQWV